MSHFRPSPFLHVANGTCTTRLIAAAGLPGALSIWADPLYEGPVPAGLSDAELLEVRTRHLAGPHYHYKARVDPVNDLAQWRAIIERHDAYDELILWFEHDLFDQLNLVQLLDWIRQHLPAAKPVSLVCIGAFPGHPGGKGLGELTPQEVASLVETRQPVGTEHYRLAAKAWHAFRAPTPEALDHLRRGATLALPFLAAAITRFLEEFPWTGDGLSRTERRLLRLVATAPTALADAFPHMADDESAYYVTDSSLAGMAEALAQESPPLLTLDPGQAADRAWLQNTVELTDPGRAVLAGSLDRVAACGIDRWLGGVHLHGRTNIWRWDDEQQRVVRA